MSRQRLLGGLALGGRWSETGSACNRQFLPGEHHDQRTMMLISHDLRTGPLLALLLASGTCRAVATPQNTRVP
jgi:hypothetical protein